MNTRELAWAAGLFDGEGCFYSQSGTRLALQLAMTDADSVRRFHRAVGGLGKVTYWDSPSLKHPMYKWRVVNFEGAQAVLAMLWYGLNARRKARATELLLNYQIRSGR